MSVSTSSTPTKLNNLHKFLSTKPDSEVLRLYLQQKHNNLLRTAFLVTLHRTWSSSPPYDLTGIGITTYDRLSVNHGMPHPPGPHGENLLQQIWCIDLHIRRDTQPHYGEDVENFHFGTTTFVSEEEALDILNQIFHQNIDSTKPELGFRPIICLSFGANSGVAKARTTTFDFDPTKQLTTVATLDAQNIAVQKKITSQISAPLQYILSIFKIMPFDLGNGGNAAMYCTTMAFLSVLRNEIYRSENNTRAKPGRYGISAGKSAQSVMQWLMERPTPPPPFGVTVYCRRCNSYMHTAVGCPGDGANDFA